MRSREVSARVEFLLRLERGEEIIEALTDFCLKKGIQSAAFSAIGAVEAAKVGLYDLKEKKYKIKEYPPIMEVVSMHGNIAQVDPERGSVSDGAGGKPFAHIHAVLSDDENNCIGGHLFGGRVAVTLEIHMRAFDERIERVLDKKIGLKLLDL